MKRYLFETDFGRVFQDEMNQAGIHKDSRLLNIACEHRLIHDFFPAAIQSENVFGLEINRALVAKVKNLRYCDVDSDRFPFEDAFFDLVISVWGMEHFKTDNVMCENFRTLKKGGKFIFITPNLYCPIFFINKVFGRKVAKIYYKYVMRSPYDPHPTHYRLNTYKAIRKSAVSEGLTVQKVTYVGPAAILYYFRFSKRLQNLVSMIDRLMTNSILYRFKPYIVCVLEK